jgi:phosphoribosylanthranilate isomerase
MRPKLSGKSWKLRIVIPKDCRSHFGKFELKRSKRNLTPTQAQQWASKISDEFWKQVDLYREGGAPTFGHSSDDVLKQVQLYDATEYAVARRQSGTAEEVAHKQVSDRWQARLADIGIDPYDDYASLPDGPAGLAFRIFKGEAVVYEVMVPEWNTQRNVSQKTKDQDASAILEMTNQVKKVGVITRPDAFHYVDYLRKQAKIKTVQRKISALNGFFSWLINRSYLPDQANPWRDMRESTPRSKSNPAEERLPWTKEEAVTLHTVAAKSDPVLADAIALAMHTGARIESLFQLRASDVHGDLLQIGTGGDKTAAGQGRWVPIHSALQSARCSIVSGVLLSRLCLTKRKRRSIWSVTSLDTQMAT